MVAIIENATSKFASKSPKTIAALGLSACYHFRLHAMIVPVENDSDRKSCIINGLRRFNIF